MQPLAQRFKNASHSIDEGFSRIEKLTQLTKYNSHVEEVTKLQNLLSLSSTSIKEEIKHPIILLPLSKNADFYDRDHVIERIHKHLTDQPKEVQLRSLALYGLGGVGVSRIVLKHAEPGKAHC
jgi:hypothetical protein